MGTNFPVLRDYANLADPRFSVTLLFTTTFGVRIKRMLVVKMTTFVAKPLTAEFAFAFTFTLTFTLTSECKSFIIFSLIFIFSIIVL